MTLSLLTAVSCERQTNPKGSSSSLPPMSILNPTQQQAVVVVVEEEEEEEEEENYIDMELNISSSSSNRYRDPCDFEFHMSSSSSSFHTLPTSTADQLFRHGRLLPLHYINPDSSSHNAPLILDCLKPPSTAPAKSTNTPLSGSRNISPSHSCRFSCELNPDDYFFEWSTEIRGFLHNRPNHSWSKKMSKSSSLCHKLRSSSWTFLKSLFTKPGVCPNDSCARAADTCNVGPPLKVKDLLYALYGEVEDRTPCKLSNAIVRSIERLELGRDVRGSSDNHRRSFSGTIRRRNHSATNKSTTANSSSGSSSSSSSSSSFSSSSFSLAAAATLATQNELPLLRSSSSANSGPEREGLIEGAIAHCKKSQSRPKINLRNHPIPIPTKAGIVTQSGDNTS